MCDVQIHVQAILSILLATFAGFGVVMSGSSILVEFFRWRRRWQALSEQNNNNGAQVMATHPGSSTARAAQNHQNSSQILSQANNGSASS